ncbi:PTS sugar transporter subunit IIA [Anaerorhabdus sp.]|uniref:PTS sugar transporter subunit IIA n=1 Tax=Anaerorhabdus sp. TaxID=1872524 RepID=UPI002FCC661F
MRKILVGTHGHFGEELLRSAEMIIGNVEDAIALSLEPGMAMEDYMEIIQVELSKLPEDTICLVDLYGGTPSTTFTILSQNFNNIVITGLNLAMFIEVYSQRDTLSTEDLAQCALDTLSMSGRNVTKELKGN